MAKAANTGKISHAVVRMYCMGTGDCFVIKFFAGQSEKFTMMIDCGVWNGKREHLRKYMLDLKKYVNNKIDLLVITHEHVDHVSVFETCRDLFIKDFEVKKIWMGWSEDDGLSKIKKWKTEHGEKKKALAEAAKKIKLAINDKRFQNSVLGLNEGRRILEAKKSFSDSLQDFANLHIHAANGRYKGMLEGMRIVKKEIARDNIEYLYPGDILEDLPGLEGVKFYVLGPPQNWDEVEAESGGEGESYTHNRDLRGTDAFAASVLSTMNGNTEGILPFDSIYESHKSPTASLYNNKKEEWRKIDNDWLFSAGSLALRISSLTNNLSLALAIEFEENKRVMLFPGDAEYGSWASWHRINWAGVESEKEDENNKKIHFTQDLLRRTVFYKIAHHMSHNGTAQKLGLDMMEHKDLACMATLDYNVIAPKWKNTMPNREMLLDLFKKTRGRLMIMNEKGLFFDFHEKEPLIKKIKSAQKKLSAREADDYKKSYVREKNNLYVEFTVKA